jgi:hypothetical protein
VNIETQNEPVHKFNQDATAVIVEALVQFGGMWANGLVITLAGFNN